MTSQKYRGNYSIFTSNHSTKEVRQVLNGNQGHQKKNSKCHLYDTARMILETINQILPYFPKALGFL